VVKARSTDVNLENYSTAGILRALSDNKSLDLFKIIASSPDIDELYPTDGRGSINTQLLISKVKLTRKQYYSRISTLISSGLVKRSNGKYLLTSLGKILYRVNSLVDQAINDHWKLKAVDALETKSSSGGIPDEEREKIIDMLIDNDDLKELLSTKKARKKETEMKAYSKDIKSASVASRIPAPVQINHI
jgi:predicted transcriptional regulator